MSQRTFNFYSIPSTTNAASSSTNKSNATTPKNTSTSKPTTQKRPLESTSSSTSSSTSEPLSKTANQGKSSKFFAQKPIQTTPPTSSSSSSSTIKKTSTTTRVVKLKRKDGKIVQDCEVYIGRALYKGGWNLPQSKWGNPYPVSSCGGSAEVACQKYRDYVLRRDDLLEDLDELDGKVLGCWCKVDASCHCHGDTLVELLEMKKKGELAEYVRNYKIKYPEPLYPLSKK